MAELAPAGARCSVYHDDDLRIERRRRGEVSWGRDSNWAEDEFQAALDEAAALRVRLGGDWEVRLIRVRFEVILDSEPRPPILTVPDRLASTNSKSI